MTKPNEPERRFRVLHVIPTLGSGGAERQLLTNLSNPALRDRFENIVVMTDAANDDRADPRNHFTKDFEKLGIKVLHLDRAGSSHVVGCIRALRRIIREEKVDLVHTHLLWANVAGRIAGRMCGVPVISSFHNTDYDPAKTRTSWSMIAKSTVIRWLDSVTARRCLTHSISVSKTVSRHIQENLGLKPETISIVYNSFAVEQVSPTCDDPRRKVFEILGLGPDDHLVLTVGRMLDQKAHLELVMAMRDICARRGDVHLAIVGSQVDTAYVARIRKAVAEYGIGANVHLLEPRYDIPDFLAAAHVFAFPSKFEGLGIALIEAMACGVPSVSSDIEVLQEVVQDKVTGLIVPVNDIPALTSAILQILDDQHLAERLGANAKMYVQEKFHPDRKAEEMAQLYERILARIRNQVSK